MTDLDRSLSDAEREEGKERRTLTRGAEIADSDDARTASDREPESTLMPGKD